VREAGSGKLEADLSGVLVVDKPAGPTSHDVVARVRRALGTSRIGHTGTLDPLATGVLPLVLGRATRLASLFSGAEKEYDAGVRLGLATDTYDAAHLSGPAPEPPPGIDAGIVEAALEQFRGTYSQTPPAYSAKKIDGVAAYKLARRNEPVLPRAVTVTVTSLTLLSFANGLAHLRVRSSAGFYVRSLAHDLGARLGCGAHLESLRRVRAGAFEESAATPLQDIESEGAGASRWIVPLSLLLPHLPGVVLNERGVRRATHGNDVAADDLATPAASDSEAAGPGRWRLLDASGMLLGIAERRPAGLLHPVIVLV
jgi:tRNA pseudouridine55 synthase